MTAPATPHTAPETLSYFDLLRQLERASPSKPRIGGSGARREEIVLLGQPPFVEFPDSNVAHFGMDETGRYVVQCRFLGMLGPQGALPLHTTYEAAHWSEMRDHAFARFLDIFNNRFLQLFFRAWSDARPQGQYDRPQEDRFAAYVGTAVGVGTLSFRTRDALGDHAKLAVAGLLGPAVKSASRLRNLIAYLFGAEVEIDQCTGMWLAMERADQSALARQNAKLGEDVVLGATVFSLQDKFTIKLKARSLGEFESFLPQGTHCERLADAVYFYLGEVFDYEVEIGLPEAETRQAQLGAFGRLGWTTWLKSKEPVIPGHFRWDCHFHPAERRGTGLSSNQRILEN